MKHLVQKYLTVCAFVFMATFVLLPVAASAQSAVQQPDPAPVQQNPTIADNVCRGVLSAQEPAPANTTIASCREEGNDSFSFIIRRVINIFSILVGAVSVIMIIIGGFRYIISGGDSSGVSGAKNTILYAIVGLVIVVFAQVIVRFILSNTIPN